MKTSKTIKTMNKLNKTLIGKKQLGQGMTEYIIIVALIAVAAIGIYGAFGNVLKSNVIAVTGAVAGNATTMNAGTTQMKASGGTNAAANVTTANGMDSYTTNVKGQ